MPTVIAFNTTVALTLNIYCEDGRVRLMMYEN